MALWWVLWGVRWTYGLSYGRWTTAERNAWTIDIVPPWILGIIVGLILGDSYLRQNRKNASLFLKQSVKHLDYLWFAFTQLAPICSSLPKFYLNKRNDIFYPAIYFSTRALPFITELCNLFYVNDIKVVLDFDIMSELLIPIALAHWICWNFK